MTYRERRERRAERLREWAAKREARSEAAWEAEHRIGDMIPLGQPILVGHHSEGRARCDVERMQRLASQSVEHGRKAEEMRSKAENIDRAAARATYSDDPDAVERLRAKLAKLEADRETVKAANAAYRREHRAELRELSAYGRDRACPYPSYVLQNLGGNITRTRQRLAQLERRAES